MRPRSASGGQTASLSWRTSPEVAPPPQRPVAKPTIATSPERQVGQVQQVAYQQRPVVQDDPATDPFGDLFGANNGLKPAPANAPPALSPPAASNLLPTMPQPPAIQPPGIQPPAIQPPGIQPPAITPPAAATPPPSILPTTPPGGLTMPNDVTPGVPSPPTLPAEGLNLPPPNGAPSIPPVIMPEAKTPQATTTPQAIEPPAAEPIPPREMVPESPSDRESKADSLNPFNYNRGAQSVPAAPRQESMPETAETEDEGDAQLRVPSTLPFRKKSQLSCDEVRAQLRTRTIEKISLDISPPFRPDIIDNAKLERLRTDFLKSQKARQWRNIQGQSLGEGILQDIEFEQIVVRSQSGQTQRFPISELSEPDLAFLSEAWGLPRQCRLDNEQYAGRCFTPSTLVWKASGLCHSPLYFEEVQLERYGHTAGPVLQPVISSAHFFVNIAVLPYKMGIHPPSECQYALGYYRPGNCAPWMIPPVPLSLRGAISQTAVVMGGIALIP